MYFLKKLSLLSIAALLVLTAGCQQKSSSSSASQEENSPATVTPTVTVIMNNMQFTPETVEIKSGDTIEWKNEDIIPHTATATSQWDSGNVAAGQTWQHTFKDAGDFAYFCTFHPTMRGKITVK